VSDRRYGRLTVIREVAPDVFKVLCDCGSPSFEIWRSCLAMGITNCGCDESHYRISKTYGFFVRHFTRKGKHKARAAGEWWSWQMMKQRCTYKTLPVFELYGAKGVKVCERWLLPDGEGFRNFIADMGPRPSGMTLDRKNPFGNYEPGNCRWAIDEEQQANKRAAYVTDEDGEPVLEGGALIRKDVFESLSDAIGF
jgi:hypothetical protein